MNSNSSRSFSRTRTLCLGLTIMALALVGCSTPHGYGADERAMRTPDGSSGVVAGSEAPGDRLVTPAMQSQSTYLSLITQMQHEGQYFASLAHLDAYEARYGHSPESTLLRGDAERLTEQPEPAARAYTALKDTPLAGAGYRGLSLLAGARGDFLAASTLLEAAVRLNSTDAVALSDLGYAKLRLDDVAGARVPLMTAAQLSPDNPKVLGNLALYLILEHDTVQAEAVMKSAGVNAQTRRAIYAQATQMSHGSVKELPALSPVAALTPLTSYNTSPAERDVAPIPTTNAALRIDFALAKPALSSVGNGDAVVATTAH